MYLSSLFKGSYTFIYLFISRSIGNYTSENLQLAPFPVMNAYTYLLLFLKFMNTPVGVFQHEPAS